MATALSTERLTGSLWHTTVGVLPISGYRVGLVPLGWYNDAPRQSIAGNVFSAFNQGASASGGAGVVAAASDTGRAASANAAGQASSGSAGVVISGGSGEIHSV